MIITYLKGDATNPQITGIKIICHVCNNIDKWGRGFVLAISKKWSAPEIDYHNRHQLPLGSVNFIKVSNTIYIANMISQKGVRTKLNPIPIQYIHLQRCLQRVANKAFLLKATVHMPRIGCGLAGGNWNKIEPIIINTLLKLKINVFVYDM